MEALFTEQETSVFNAQRMAAPRGTHSWMGSFGTNIEDLVAFNDRFYVRTGNNLGVSSDGGKTWKSVRVNAKEHVLEPTERELPGVNFSFNSKLAIAAGKLYSILPEEHNLHFLFLHEDDNILSPVPGIPSFNEGTLSAELMAAIAEAEGIDLIDDAKRSDQLANSLRHIVAQARACGFAVSGETFYIEHKRMLFKWKPGETKWTHTGLIDLGKPPAADLPNEFKVAASGEIVYVGKREGKLFQSFDAGGSWKDITASLPLHFTRFNEIRFIGSTVYVATDTGVLSSQNG